MKSWIGVFAFTLGMAIASHAQSSVPVDSNKLVFSYIDGRDTIPWVMLPEVDVLAAAPSRLAHRVREWNRLRNAVYVTYPYARIAAGVLEDVDTHLSDISGKKQRKAFLNEKEKEMKQKFGPKIEDLSIYQGKVLIKLIYRETGDDCYDLIKELKGGFSARVWQTVAFLFGSNLKSQYNRQQDADIESIVKEIETNPYYYNAYYYRSRFN